MEKKRTQTFVEFCGEIIEENKYKWKRRKQDEEFKRKNEEESLDKFLANYREKEEMIEGEEEELRRKIIAMIPERIGRKSDGREVTPAPPLPCRPQFELKFRKPWTREGVLSKNMEKG